MPNVSGPYLGKLMTTLGWDGTYFQALGVDGAGFLRVHVLTFDSAVQILGDIVGDGTAPIVVTPTGELSVVLAAGFENHVICNGVRGLGFAPAHVNAAGQWEVSIDSITVPNLIYGTDAGDVERIVKTLATRELEVHLTNNFENHVIAQGYNGVGFQPVLVDVSGHLQVDVLSSALPAGASTWAYQVQTMGFIGTPAAPEVGTVNKRLETLEATVAQVRDLEDSGRMYRVTHTKVGAGNYAMVGHTVAANTVFVMTSVGGYNEDGTIAKLFMGSWDTVDNCWFNYGAPIAQFEVLSWAGRAYLQAGWEPKLYFDTVGDGDDLVLTYSGYTLDV